MRSVRRDGNSSVICTGCSLSLKWLILCCLALSLNGSNLVGYSRARLGTRESVARQFSQWFLTTVLRRHRAETAERTEIIK